MRCMCADGRISNLSARLCTKQYCCYILSAKLICRPGKSFAQTYQTSRPISGSTLQGLYNQSSPRYKCSTSPCRSWHAGQSHKERPRPAPPTIKSLVLKMKNPETEEESQIVVPFPKRGRPLNTYAQTNPTSKPEIVGRIQQ